MEGIPEKDMDERRRVLEQKTQGNFIFNLSDRCTFYLYVVDLTLISFPSFSNLENQKKKQNQDDSDEEDDDEDAGPSFHQAAAQPQTAYAPMAQPGMAPLPTPGMPPGTYSGEPNSFYIFFYRLQ